LADVTYFEERVVANTEVLRNTERIARGKLGRNGKLPSNPEDLAVYRSAFRQYERDVAFLNDRVRDYNDARARLPNLSVGAADLPAELPLAEVKLPVPPDN
jgi:hypothetical protein